jgi:hypothetical protein
VYYRHDILVVFTLQGPDRNCDAKPRGDFRQGERKINFTLFILRKAGGFLPTRKDHGYDGGPGTALKRAVFE